MNNYRLLFFACATSILLSCEKSTEEKTTAAVIQVDDFPENINLQGEQILTQVNKNAFITVLDTLLLMTNYDGKDSTLYDIYGKSSEQYLGAVGTKGDGPQEWRVVFNNEVYEVGKEGVTTWFYEMLRGFLVQVNLNKVIAAKSPVPIIEKKITINSKVFPFNHLFYINDTKIIGNPSFGDEIDRVRIKSYNPQTQEVKKSDLFPRIKNAKVIPSQVLYNFYFTSFKKHPTKNLFVQAMSVMNRIDIFDEDLNLLRSIVSGKSWQDDFLDAKKIDVATDYMKDIEDGYGTATVSEDFIFALVANKKKSAITGEVQKSFIKVFDWEGQPKCLIEVNDDLINISFDRRDGYLYAADFNNEKFLRYDLKKLLASWK
jgi:hypothetical protein